MLVTALSPTIGYDRAAAIAHLAMEEDLTLREAALRVRRHAEQSSTPPSVLRSGRLRSASTLPPDAPRASRCALASLALGGVTRSAHGTAG